ncbi:hypothetical protein [Aerococcus urinaeequi]|uniref:hypothetical protein n=1 Tax=Aerococcus urinaeequi TaxID=51665 RepID=UPI003EC81408
MNVQEEILKIKNEMIDEFDKRVEALKVEEKEFPTDGDEYWYIDDEGYILNEKWDGLDFEEYRLAIGNIFKIKEQAEFAVEKLKVEAELRKFSRPFEVDDDNCFIQINSFHNILVVDIADCYQTQGTIYFESEEKANEAIDTLGADRIKKYIFGVEG